MKVASTLWPDIKSQKISERRFRLKWTKCSPRTNPNSIKTRQAPAFRQEEAQDSPSKEVGGSWSLEQADRPTWSADLACGPHRLNRACGVSPLVPYVGCEGFTLWLPAINTKGGVENRTHTHTTHTSHRLSCIPCIVFSLSRV